MTEPWYCTREDVKHALDVKETARNNGQVDRAIASVSRSVDEQMHRQPGGFFPTLATRVFDWPTKYSGDRLRLWLDDNELISATSVTAGGTAITGYFLEPVNSGPPFTSVDIDRSSADSFEHGDYAQHRIAIDGKYGHADRTEAAGALAGAVNGSVTTVTVTDSSLIGVGQLLLVDDERMIVDKRSMVDTGQNLGAPLTKINNDEVVTVATGSAYAEGEVILIDAEKMLVVEIAGNNLVVKRAWDGSTLAEHDTGADVYAPRQLTVRRGVLGTTAAAHDSAAVVARQVVPPLIRQLTIAESMIALAQENTGYGRKIGSGDSERPAGGAGIEDLRALAYAAHGRKVF